MSYTYLVKRALVGILIFSLAGCGSKKSLEGQVVDYDSKKGLEGVKVVAWQTGWDLSKMVWDHTYKFEAVTDTHGTFRLQYNVGSSAHIRIEHPEYVPLDGWFEENTTVRLSLKAKHSRFPPLRLRMMKIGVKNNRPVGWNFASGKESFDKEKSDIFPSLSEGFLAELKSRPMANLGLVTPPGGGIQFVSTDDLGVSREPMVYADRAPGEHYATSSEIDFQNTSGVFFVRAKDGRHYAKFEFLHTSYGMEAVSQEKRNWLLVLPYVYDPTGNPELPYRK